MPPVASLDSSLLRALAPEELQNVIACIEELCLWCQQSHILFSEKECSLLLLGLVYQYSQNDMSLAIGTMLSTCPMETVVAAVTPDL